MVLRFIFRRFVEHCLGAALVTLTFVLIMALAALADSSIENPLNFQNQIGGLLIIFIWSFGVAFIIGLGINLVSYLPANALLTWWRKPKGQRQRTLNSFLALAISYPVMTLFIWLGEGGHSFQPIMIFVGLVGLIAWPFILEWLPK